MDEREKKLAIAQFDAAITRAMRNGGLDRFSAIQVVMKNDPELRANYLAATHKEYSRGR